MSVPVRVDDGDFRIALLVDPIEFAFPFADKGDPNTFVAHVKRRQHCENYRRPVLMAKYAFNLGNAYLVDFGEPRSVGCGLLEWTERCASIPVPRSEYGSTSYTQQLLVRTNDNGAVSYSVDEYSAVRDARFFYEYSLNRPLPRRIAPKFIPLLGNVYAVGGATQVVYGTEVLAEDTTSEVYLCLIYCRRSVFIINNPLKELTE